MAGRGTIRIGIGGWTFPPWRDNFYPPTLPHKDELVHASRALTSIEINGTYYRSQTPDIFAKWHDETPDDFVFSLKAPRFATNRRVLAEAGPSIERFFAGGVARLGAKLGPVNWQFMATKSFDLDDFAAFLNLLPPTLDGRALRHVVEVRHASFATAGFVDLARAQGVAIALAGDSAFVRIAAITAPFVYLRLMGTSDGEARGYGDAAIAAWAARLKTLAGGRIPADLAPLGPKPPAVPRDVFAYVIGGEKPRNPAAAQALIAAIGHRPTKPRSS